MNVDDTGSFARVPGAKFFIPNEDEWYKAAYHNKSAGIAASYFDFPTGTNLVPGNDVTESTRPGDNANYNFAIGAPYYRTEVGIFRLSASPYGTFDQGGNVFERNESPGSFSRARGGSFGGDAPPKSAGNRYMDYKFLEDYYLGFRLAAAVPEPSSLLLAALASVGLLVVAGHRRRLTAA
jgi:formylglycine-generating enzyme